MLSGGWRIELLGGLRARHGDRVISRFRSYKTGVLLAYLAHFLKRSHPREELVELLWPEAAPEAGQMSLRTSLSSLRRQLEPPGTPAGSVLVADRANVSLNPAAVTTDAAVFESALQSARQAGDPQAREALLTQAFEIYQGPLLPGLYEDWVL